MLTWLFFVILKHKKNPTHRDLRELYGLISIFLLTLLCFSRFTMLPRQSQFSSVLRVQKQKTYYVKSNCITLNNLVVFKFVFYSYDSSRHIVKKQWRSSAKLKMVNSRGRWIPKNTLEYIYFNQLLSIENCF